MEITPIFYALGVGALATVNPCGFAMLPAYLAYYLGTQEAGFTKASAFARSSRALIIGATVTLGFILLFGFAGSIISAGARFLIGWMPWFGLLIGVVLVLLGFWLLTGRWIGIPFLERINIRPRGGLVGMFLFGIAYAIASLSCTLPVFLLVVGGALTTEGIFSGFLQFVAYGVGMGLVITALTLSAALFKGVLATFLRRFIPYIERLSAVLLLGAGLYIVYYWLSRGQLLAPLF
ncbi:MAG: cytochrome c biogenesis protein CcdA [Chloroflexi bacterium]|nr:cytochrome c biogenesis protein CcdA [Chloroflexota bacterium]